MNGDESRKRNAAASPNGDRLTDIRGRAEAIAEGPLELWERGFGGYDVVPVDRRGEPRGELAGIRGVFMRRENAEFFAHARADLLALLDALEEERRGRLG